MHIEQKSKFIADQCKPCNVEFYNGAKHGAMLALSAEQITIKKTVTVLEKILKDEYVTIETRNQINNLLKLL